MSSKATKATVARRIEEVLRIRQDGAQFWDVLQYVAEKQQANEEPWTVPDGGKPIAERTVWWYVQRADKLEAETFRNEAGRQKQRRKHYARRERLYALAVSQGDVRAALAVLDSEAKLLDLFPAEKKAKPPAPDGKPDDILLTVLDALRDMPDARQRVAARLMEMHNANGNGHATANGTCA